MKELENAVYDNNHLTKKVDVGGVIVYADYFQMSYSRKFDWKLSTWDKITIPFYRIRRVIDNTYWNICYGLQRMLKEYDSVDVFSMDTKFIRRYQKILAEYKITHWGHPSDMTNEEWEDIIDKMIFHLYYMDEDNVETELEDAVPEGWAVSRKAVSEVMDKHKDEFFKLFSEYLFDLWD